MAPEDLLSACCLLLPLVLSALDSSCPFPSGLVPGALGPLLGLSWVPLGTLLGLSRGPFWASPRPFAFPVSLDGVPWDAPASSWGSLGVPFTSFFGRPFGGPLGSTFWSSFWAPFLELFWEPFWTSFLGPFWEPFWSPLWGPFWKLFWGAPRVRPTFCFFVNRILLIAVPGDLVYKRCPT